MASLSKRNLARNEKALQDLIKNVPGNDRCADCQARNPGWASWSLGIFLCMRCAALHRKLGTHVSKVKSLSMDSWSNDQVENMRKIGNTISNKTYNPSNTRPPVPLDVDEVDSAMGRFIRQKYEHRAFIAGASARSPAIPVNTGGTASSDDQPPPPPPKPGRKFAFGLRSSSALALSGGRKDLESPKKKQSQPNKQSRVFGASIGVREEGMEWKLITLKEMGFSDDKRNTNILMGLGGDLERAIESLVRLGEGPPRAPAKTSQSSRNASGANTPSAQDAFSQPQFGVSIQAQTPAEQSNQRTAQSATQASFPAVMSYNPFETDAPSSAPLQRTGLEDQFQQMNIVPPPPQPLFPNTTGGSAPFHDPMHQARLQQSMTPPPVPQMPQQYAFNNPYAQQQSHNPFMQSTLQPSPSFANNPFAAPQQATGSSNPFVGQTNLNAVLSSPWQSQFQQSPAPPAPPQSSPWSVQPQHSPANPTFTAQNSSQELNPPQFAPQQQPPSGTQPLFPAQFAFAPQPTFSQPASPASFQSQPQPQTLMPQRTGRIDKSSILALYNFPHLAPSSTTASGTSSPALPGTPPVQHGLPAATPSPQQAPAGASHAQKRSVTMPVAGSKNPFVSASAGGATAAPATGVGHSSQLSRGLDLDESGRHSPDAFASLSARFMR